MNKLLALLSGLLVLPLTLPGAETAQGRLFCLSLRFQQGADANGLSTLDLSSTLNLDAPNGELSPTFSNPDHFCLFRQFSEIFGEIVQEGEIDLNVLASTDSNSNGFADFFEVSQAVSGVSTGAYSSVVDSGTVRATWNRPAASKDGTCVLRLTSKTSGLLGDFTHPFELLEYTGSLKYTPGATNVSGTLNLTQSGAPSSGLSGTILFLKSSTDRFNSLELQPGSWTNAAGPTLVYTNDVFQRGVTLPTNYFGFVEFDDGDPSTPDPDYLTWFLSIDDSNDSNGNGVPDFSDDPGPVVVRLPLLSLSLGSTNLLLSIRQGLGSSYEIQQINSLSQTNWTAVLSLQLTNDPQTVPLPLPTNSASFWRVRML